MVVAKKAPKENAMDAIYGKRFLDYLQTSVITGAYKKPRPVATLSRTARSKRVRRAGEKGHKLKQAMPMLSPTIQRSVREKRVDSACENGQNLQRGRRTKGAACKRSSRPREMGTEFHVTDAMMAFQLRVAESQAFVERLDPLYPSSRKMPESSFLLQEAPAPTSYASMPDSAERNFRKQYSVRRNGIGDGRARKRISCPKSRMLQREADNAERNTWAVETAKRGMSDLLAESLFISSFADAWHLLAMHFPRMACNARRNLLDQIRASAIVDLSTKRRRKTKGGGAMNAYGSEGPGRRSSGERPTPLATMGLYDPWRNCMKAWEGLPADLSMETTPIELRKYNGTNFVPLNTCADGACAIHATFGRPVLTSLGWKLTHSSARGMIGQCLSSSWEAVRARLTNDQILTHVSSSLWNELFTTPEDRVAKNESLQFRARLQMQNPEEFQEYTRFANNAAENKSRKAERRRELQVSSRRFFVQELELSVIRVIAQKCNMLPLEFLSVVTMEDFDFNSLFFQLDQNLRDWLNPPVTQDEETECVYISGTRVNVDDVHDLQIPRSKYEALFHASPHFDQLRESFLIAAGLNKADAGVNSHPVSLCDHLHKILGESVLSEEGVAVVHRFLADVATSNCEVVLTPPGFTETAWSTYVSTISCLLYTSPSPRD